MYIEDSRDRIAQIEFKGKMSFFNNLGYFMYFV